MRIRARWIVVVAISAVVLAAVVVLVWPVIDPLHARGRREWAARAIAMVEARANDKAWLERELATVKRSVASRLSEGGWMSDGLLLAKDGQWMICESVCAKEQKAGVWKDLFVGKGSDGRWYYSTFHFCVGKCVLIIEPQPETLKEMVDGYWMVPFDGKVEHCLEETWTGGAYGMGKTRPSGLGGQGN
jgi:hypothetical protein